MYFCLLEMLDMNCSIINEQIFIRIKCDCSLQNNTYQVILKSLRESSGNITAIRTMCENDLKIPVNPSLSYDIIVFQISIVNGIVQYDTLHYYYQQSLSVKDVESTSTKGSARTNNGTVYLNYSIDIPRLNVLWPNSFLDKIWQSLQNTIQWC